MANYPTSLDSFTNPTSVDSLNSPSHSLQHADTNDAIEALEAKLGIGASPAGSATSGQVLTAGTGGTTTWQTLTIPESGLTQIVPTSVTKGASGSASVSAGGAVTITGTESISINGCFSSTYDTYLIHWSGSGSSDTAAISYQLVSGTTANTSSIYYFGNNYLTNGGGPFRSYTGTTSSAKIGEVGTTSSLSKIVINNPFASKITIALSEWSTFSTTPIIDAGAGFGLHNSTSSFDGIKFLVGAGTFTGIFRVFGYKNG